jgi:hypothetical protein
MVFPGALQIELQQYTCTALDDSARDRKIQPAVNVLVRDADLQ